MTGAVRMGVTREGARVTVAARGPDGESLTLGMSPGAAGALCANLQAALSSDADFAADFSLRATLEVHK